MLLTIISAIIALSVLIIFHEFGHFLIAKCSGIRVLEFSLGLGPKIIGIKKGETLYKLSWIPFGGFVKLAGMEPKEIKHEPYEFASKRTPIKTAVVAAGPVFNFILAFLIFTITAFIFGIPTLPTTTLKSASELLKPGDKILAINDKKVKNWNTLLELLSRKDTSRCLIKRGEVEYELMLPKNIGLEPLIPPIIGRVAKDGPAYHAGIQKGDLITKITTKEIKDKDTILLTTEIKDWDTLVSIIHRNPAKELSLGWLRHGAYMEAKLTPEPEQILIDDTLKEIGLIKVLMPTGRKLIGIRAFKLGLFETTGTVLLTFWTLKKLITGKIPFKTIGGPIAIVQFAGESAKWGIESFLSLLAFLSIALFIFNLIPFPPLDGGQVLLIFIERIKKSPISERTISLVQNIGFALLLILIFYITIVNDIPRLLK